MKFKIAVLFLLLIQVQLFAQDIPGKAKLVVGVVVDQMRYDYLTKFQKDYSEDGFKRLQREGFEMKNFHFNYVPTYTGPGHASVYTGTSPMNHGIVANNWYNKVIKERVYCVSDPSVTGLGVDSDNRDGKMSPHRMLTTSFADQNRLHTQFRGKTIGVSIKDRGAILPAGHTANAAYWFVGGDQGDFISSDFYMDKLPKWVTKFNASDVAKSYLKVWDTYQDISTYTESGSDLNDYENGFSSKEEATFPYNLKKLAKENGDYSIIRSTPYGNDLLLDFAKQAIVNEELGQDEFTDVFTLSFSSTDYVGHNFGVNSKEIQDTYVRLDRNIADLMTFLDQQVGKGNYTLFLTADHGAVHVPQFLKDNKIPAGYFEVDEMRAALEDYLSAEFGLDHVIESIYNHQIFLDYSKFDSYAEFVAAQNEVKHFLLQYKNIDKVYTREMLENSDFTDTPAELILRGFHQKRSGDVAYVLENAYISYSKKGSTHGSGNNYDTQAPLLMYGNGIKSGKTYKRYHIPDIAPTISALLGIELPSGATGTIISEVLE
ncbi:alkaline phosphatase PafA [Psychroflexus sediminis]|uniref:Type I phosphodiesterase / nucleotide pyrophosphatase n=1 Tax=Psychroflexus sediminis TaxID=470826 RepID=A0A1G7Y403_9FLAO|nr:alkaline phosphatase PafA [Psychroflexus sediminis]SDG90986.1 Type I phosphodiesterase / nucleotide pyrophosphatase [Psychroflexus sediminis]